MSFISQGVRDAPELGVGPARRSRRCILLHRRDSCCMWGLGLDCGPVLAAKAVADPACLLIGRLPFCWQAAFQLNAGGGWLQGRAKWHHLLFHELAK